MSLSLGSRTSISGCGAFLGTALQASTSISSSGMDLFWVLIFLLQLPESLHPCCSAQGACPQGPGPLPPTPGAHSVPDGQGTEPGSGTRLSPSLHQHHRHTGRARDLQNWRARPQHGICDSCTKHEATFHCSINLPVSSYRALYPHNSYLPSDTLLQGVS